MSKETDFKFYSATVGANEGIQAGFDLQSGDWQAVQDISKYRKQQSFSEIKNHIMVKQKVDTVRWQLSLTL